MPALRETTHKINKAFTDRWSTISFKKEPIAETTLMSFFEAARWAPSSYNSQPWRFVYALNDDSDSWSSILGTMHPMNQAWASNAAALVVFIARNRWIPPNMDIEVDLPWNSFDVGAACMSFSLQATLSGWHTHAIGGFDQELARKTLGIPEEFDPLLVVAVGKYDPKQEHLPTDLHKRDQAAGRVALDELAFKNKFKIKESYLP